MSTFTTERWIDRVDPYGYARQASLKTAYVAVIFFLVNAFWKAPTLAVLTMCVAGAGIALIEMPSVNTPQKKDLSYIAFTLLTIVTVSIFRFFSYFTVLELLAVVGWSYVLYRIVATDPEKAQIVAIVILIGFVSLEAPGATDFWTWVNQTAFFVQFAVIAFLAHKLFPNRYQHILTNIVRQIGLLQQQFASRPSLDRTELASRFIKHLAAIEQVQPLLPARAREHMPGFVHALWQYQQCLERVMRSDIDSERQRARDTHHCLLVALSNPKRQALAHDKPSNSAPDDQRHTAAAARLLHAWRGVCQPA